MVPAGHAEVHVRARLGVKNFQTNTAFGGYADLATIAVK